MSAMDTSRRVSFVGLEFPWLKSSISSAQRVGIHEFAYLDGAQLETLNRRPYQINISSVFDENMEEQYPGTLTRILPQLRRMYEAKTSGQLVLFRFGALQAFLSSFREEAEATVGSGVVVTLEFIEQTGLTIGALLAPAGGFDQVIADMTLVQRYRAELESAKRSQVGASDWDKLQAAVDSLMAIRDRGELFASRAEQKLLSVDRMIRQVDSFITDPVGYKLLEALRNLWSSSRKLVKDSTLTSTKILTWPVTRRMPIGQIAMNIYGDTSRTLELLQLNDIATPYAVPAGSKLRYYQPTLKVAA